MSKQRNIHPCKVENCYVETKNVKNAQLYEIDNPETGEIQDSYYIVRNHSQLFYDYHHFVFIINLNGSLWVEGNLYLKWKVENNPTISPSRIKFIASVLKEFKSFCDITDQSGNKITNLLHPAAYEDTPTHRFHNFLVDTRSAKTGKRLMPVVCDFYQWMIEHNGFITPFPLWNSKMIQLQTGKYVEVRDVCQFIGTKTYSLNSQNHITDGNILRPLNVQEQIVLEKAYTILGNPEYKLAYWISKESMARKQTILTLRLYHFIDSLPNSSQKDDVDKWYHTLTLPNDGEELSIMVGKGHDADSKQGLYEAYPIYIHGWLYKRVIQYIVSKRAFHRRSKALPQDESNPLKQYIFLTERGHPMYHAKNDKYYNKITETGLKILHEGSSMDKWISETLKQKIRKMGYNFQFHFHDIRATAASNFLERQKDDFGDYSNEVVWSMAINELMLRLNHSSQEMTYRYLRHLAKKEKAPLAQANYENFLQSNIQIFDEV